ncbi:AraC family transcriptional regulator [Botrimarina mediterranea]|uniref:Xylose operon regulatory protein n=1 Tax=Botrimarina mediterranea TaxID=2528022 RepID=A0A518K7P9_9BACT|nr:XylR family transcriptional regulator [Botrimarina mediterranea]QDV73824.1 Xylose operon regulatory protein [Botrimarina mediterranea]
MTDSQSPGPSSGMNADDRKRQITVLIEADDAWGRSVLQAIARFASQANWELLIAPRDAERRLRIPEEWSGDGVIALVRDVSLLKHLRRRGMPTVNISGMFHNARWLGHVATDNFARARLAYEHFSSLRVTHFATYCPSLRREADLRGEEFVRYVHSRGYPCEVLVSEADAARTERSSDRQRIAAKLSILPKPVGVFVSDPYPARELVETCQSHGVDVPGEVLVLSGDEDDLLCNLILPSVSSIELASHRIGWEACKILDSMVRTGTPPSQPQLLAPLGICARRSTDHNAIGDSCMESVQRYIQQHATGQLQIRDLVRVAGMSRRSMELRFREVFGRSPAEEIRRVRVEKARQMLLNSSMSVSGVAAACGFSSGPYLTSVFRKVYGKTPSDLRAGRSVKLHGLSRTS